MKKIHIYLGLLMMLQVSCNKKDHGFDATGSFEAIERTISAQANGIIEELTIEEGQLVNIGDTLGVIDIGNLELQAQQVEANIQAIRSQLISSDPQVSVIEAQLASQQGQISILEQQMSTLDHEIMRFRQLVESDAAPQKQLDDLLAQKKIIAKQIEVAGSQERVLQTQIKSAKETAKIQNRAILSQQSPAEKQLELIQSQINDGLIISQHKGTIINQIAYDGEFTGMGKPLYTIADLENMILRAYITGDQLANIWLHQKVTVRTDDGQGEYRENTGIITWISDQAEFTPKTIQTKNERANQVYAIKIKVPNDGTYKIGMYGEIIFENHD